MDDPDSEYLFLTEAEIPWTEWSTPPVPASPAMRKWVDREHAALFLKLLYGEPAALQRRYDALREELRRYTAAAVTPTPAPRRRKSKPPAFAVSASLGVR